MADFVFLHLGQRRFGLPVTALRETFEPTPVSPVPWAPKCLQGLLNLRGEILPLISLHPFLFATPPARSQRSLFVVVDLPQSRFATPVERLTPREVIEEAWQPHPERALYPVLEQEIHDEAGCWEILNLDRLLLFLTQSLSFSELQA